LGDVSNYEITFDGKKMLVKVGNEYAMNRSAKDKIEFKGTKSCKDYKLQVSGLDMKLDRTRQWTRSTTGSGATCADFSHAPIHERRRVRGDARQVCGIGSFVNHRNDSHLSYRRLIGELNNACVRRGRRTTGDAADQARLLGAERVAATRRRRLIRSKESCGRHWNKARALALTAIGLNVSTGDYILAVNASGFVAGKYLRRAHWHGGQTGDSLRVNSKPADDGALILLLCR